MFGRVLVGVDGAQGGRDAIALATQLADEDATTSLVNVFGAGLMPGKATALLLGVELEQSRELLERERRAAAPDAEPVPCADRSVGHALHALAERRRAEVIVVGASRHGFLGRLLLGSDTISALNGAPCAVAVAPFGYAERAHPLATLGVGYDGSPESERALETARALAPRLGARIRVVSVVSLQSVPYGEPIAENWPDAAKGLIEDQRRRVRDLADVEVDVTYGEASEELLSLGEQVDLLIVGSRGYGPVGRLMHGSTSNQLARRVRCPLLVLPRSIAHGKHDDWELPLEVAMPDGSQVSTRP